MKQFLSIVLRNQFNLFYRFGYTFLPTSQLIEFDGKITDKTKGQIKGLFSKITPFEYDEEYIILHLEKESSSNDESIKFEIQEIVAIYPLSAQAKASIESRIDTRIKLEKPIFESILPSVENSIESKEVIKAIDALGVICQIDGDLLDEYTSNINPQQVYKGLTHRKEGTKAAQIRNGNYWEYLIAYDRYDFFPKNTLGYFYDAGQLFAYSKGLDSFEGSGLHQYLEKLNKINPSIRFTEVCRELELSESTKNYISQTTTENDIKQYIIAPLFLMLKDEIRSADDISETNLIKNLKYLKSFGDSFYYVLVLLGVFFGFRRFYDSYYDTLDLRFYKKHSDPFKKITSKDRNKKHKSKLGQTSELKDKDASLKSDKKKEKYNISLEEKDSPSLKDSTNFGESETKDYIETDDKNLGKKVEKESTPIKKEQTKADDSHLKQKSNEKHAEQPQDYGYTNVTNVETTEEPTEKEQSSIEEQISPRDYEGADAEALQAEQQSQDESQIGEVLTEKPKDSNAEIKGKTEQQSESKNTLETQIEIIEEMLKLKDKIRFIDIAREITNKTREKINKERAEEITDSMKDIEKIKIGSVKNPNGIKRVNNFKMEFGE